MYKFNKKKIDDNTVKYQFEKPDNSNLSYAEFIQLLKSKNKDFIKEFDRYLSQIPAELSPQQFPSPAFFWECVPVSSETVDREFEFVAVKSEALDNITQDYSSFQEYFDKSNDKNVVSFPSLSKDAILVVPMPVKGHQYSCSDYDDEIRNYKNLREFNCEASIGQKESFWQEVGKKMSESLVKDNAPKWLSTHGLGVSYLHVRIDSRPKYYSWAEYKEWKKFKQRENRDEKNKPTKPVLNNGDRGNYNPKNHGDKSQKGNETEKNQAADNSLNDPSKPSKIDNFNEQKKKILQNLDKISFDQAGHFSNAEMLKDPNVDSLKLKEETGIYQVKIDGETINLREFEKQGQDKDYLEIRNAIINSIKQNISDWEIKRDKRALIFLENRKTGQKVWKTIFVEPTFEEGEKEWDEIETAIENFDSSKVSKSSSASENDQPEKNFPWKIVLPVGAIMALLLGIIIFSLAQIQKKKKYYIIKELKDKEKSKVSSYT